jgi:hypothetical protein
MATMEELLRQIRPTTQTPATAGTPQNTSQGGYADWVYQAAQKAGKTPDYIAKLVQTGQGNYAQPTWDYSGYGGVPKAIYAPGAQDAALKAKQEALSYGIDPQTFVHKESFLGKADPWIAAIGAGILSAGALAGPAAASAAASGTATAPAVGGLANTVPVGMTGVTTGGGLAGGVGAAGVGAGTPLVAGAAPASGLGSAVGVGSSLSGGIGTPGMVSGATTGSATTTAATSGGSSLNGVLGSIFNPSTSLGGASIGGLAGQALLDLYAGNKQSQNAADAARAADPFGSQRGQYQQDLAALMNDPSSFANNPAYKFARDEGQAALERSNVAKGYLGSGNMGYDLMNYGQQAAYKGLNDEKNFLAKLAGADTGSPAAAGQLGLTGQNQGLAQQYQAAGSLGTLAGGLLGVTKPQNNTVSIA